MTLPSAVPAAPVMNKNTIQIAITPGTLALLALVCIVLGVLVAPGRGLQDVGGVPVTQYTPPSGASADSNNRMIAVTGVDRTGASVLYLVDTESKQLAVYQATGGTSSKMGLKLIGARRLDLDLQLFGFNDQSDYSYRELQAQFADLAAGE